MDLESKILNSTQEAVYARDLDMNILYVNRAATALTGWSLQEATRKKCWEVFSDKEGSCRDACRAEEVIANNKVVDHTEVEFKTSDGDLRKMRVFISPIEDDGRATGAVVSMSDITYMKKIEQTNLKTLVALEKELKKRKDTQRKHWQYSNRHRSLFNNSIVPQLVIDPEDGRIVDANLAAAAFYGHSVDKLKTLRISDINTMSEEGVAQELARAKMGKCRHFFFEHRLASGEVRDVEIYSGLYVDDDRQLLLGIIHDITETKQAEEELRKSEERFRRFFEMPLIGAAIYRSTDKQWITVNDALCKMLGYSREELMDSTWVDITHPGDIDENIRLFEAAVSGSGDDAYSMDKRFIRKDGGITHATIHAQCVRKPNGTTDYNVLFVQDITERKEAADALKESETRFHSLFEEAGDSIYIIDPATNTILDVNRNAVELLGYSRDELLEMNPADLYRTGDVRRNSEPFAELKKTGHLVFESIQWRKDGTPVMVEVNARMVDLGKRRVIQSIVRNVTERYEAEAQTTRLGRIVESLTSEIYAFNAETLKFVLVNQGARENLGYTSDELKALTPLDLKPEFTGETFAELIRPLRDGSSEQIIFETRQLRKDGSVYTVSVRLQLMQDESPPIFLAMIEDITKKKAAEQEVLTLSRAVEQSPASVIITDMKGNIEYVNPKFTEVTGYTSGEIIGKNPRILKTGHTPPEEYKRLWSTIECGGIWTGELHNKRKDGSVFWERAVILGVRDNSGNIINYLAIKEDITEQKKIEDALKASESSLVNAQRLAKVGSFNRDLVTGEAVWSQEMYDIYGVDTAEFDLTFDNITQFVHPDDHDIFVKKRQNVLGLDGPTQQSLEHRIVRPDGEERIVVVGIEITRDDSGKALKIAGTTQDITERKQADEELHASEARYRSVVETAADAIIAIDSGGTIVAWNTGARTMFGYEIDEAVGKLVTLIIPERYRNVHKAGLRRLARGYKPRLIGQPLELEGRRKDGSQFPIEMTLGLWKAGDETLYNGIVRDISQRKRVEQELRQAHKLEALGTLAGGIAHDLNNMLMPILGLTKLAMKQLPADHPTRPNHETVMTAANRAKELVQQILTFSRAEGRERKIEPLDQGVREVLGLLRSTLPSSIKVKEKISKGAGVAMIDPIHVHQILMNLGSNAADAMGGRGVLKVSLTRHTASKASVAEHASLKPGRYHKLTVADDGEGINPTTIERIFDPFFTTKVVGKGTGMGLSVVHSIVADYGGKVTVSSMPNKGTKFVLYFPLVA